jgi:hypothetical protein
VLQCTRQAPPRCIGTFKIMEEREEELKTRFQVSFLIRLNLGDMIYFKGGGVGLSHPKILKFWNVTKIH